MDATDMFPHGFHPLRDVFLPHDISAPAPVIPRLDAVVKYYFVDYNISSYFPEGTERQLVLGLGERDGDVPELSDEVLYDPFKVDIFMTGNMLRREFVRVRSGFLQANISIHWFPELLQSRLHHALNRNHDTE